MFSDFKFLLNRAVGRSGARSYVERKAVLKYFSDSLENIFDKKIEENFQIFNFSEGVINVACLSEEDAINLNRNAHIIIDKINEKLDKVLVQEIRTIT